MRKVYGAGPISRRRATRGQMAARHDALYEIIRVNQPTGVRFTYYRAVAQGLVPKTDAGYRMVQRAVLEMRRERPLRARPST